MFHLLVHSPNGLNILSNSPLSQELFILALGHPTILSSEILNNENTQMSCSPRTLPAWSKLSPSHSWQPPLRLREAGSEWQQATLLLPSLAEGQSSRCSHTPLRGLHVHWGQFSVPMSQSPRWKCQLQNSLQGVEHTPNELSLKVQIVDHRSCFSWVCCLGT